MSKKPYLKILLVQVANMNLGDQVLADNDEYLLRRALFPRRYDILRYSISSRDVGQVRYVDAVVFAGGIMKVTNEYFWQWVPELIREAERYGVPVFLSAIGCEAFYPEDPRSIELKEALNLPCVKGISCRDDIETLRRDYITNPGIRLTAVTDPAVWCRQTYREALRTVDSPVMTDAIGLGVVREHLFADYGNPEMDGAAQLAFWVGVIRLLESQGRSWVLFTNGDRQDEEMAQRVLQSVGHGSKVPAPRDGADLTAMISLFSGVIAGRMHSNIIAYALGIPSIGFVWNRKLRFWSERIGHPERFLEISDMTAGRAVDALQEALSGRNGRTGPGLRQRLPVLLALRGFVRQHVRYREKPAEADIRYEDHLVATALGGIELRYRNTNSPDAFAYSLQHGYTRFHLDLRLTSDGELVCVNRWHRDTYKMLGIPHEGVPEDGSETTGGPKSETTSGSKSETPSGTKSGTTGGRKSETPSGTKSGTTGGRKSETPGGPKSETKQKPGQADSPYRPALSLETFLAAKCYHRFSTATLEDFAEMLAKARKQAAAEDVTRVPAKETADIPVKASTGVSMQPPTGPVAGPDAPVTAAKATVTAAKATVTAAKATATSTGVPVAEDTATREPVYPLILSVGRPKEEELRRMMEKLQTVCEKTGLEPGLLTLRLERKKDVELVRNFGYTGNIMYYYVPSKEILNQDSAESPKENTTGKSIENSTDVHPPAWPFPGLSDGQRSQQSTGQGTESLAGQHGGALIGQSGEQLNEQGSEQLAADCISRAKWCVRHGIHDIGMHPDYCTDELIKALHEMHMRICLFSLVKTERVIDAIRRGVDLVGNHYYDVEYLYRLTKDAAESVPARHFS